MKLRTRLKLGCVLQAWYADHLFAPAFQYQTITDEWKATVNRFTRPQCPLGHANVMRLMAIVRPPEASRKKDQATHRMGIAHHGRA